MAPERVCTFVAACCMIHNIAIDYNEPLGNDDDDEDQVDLGNNYEGANRAEAVRSHITNTFLIHISKNCNSNWHRFNLILFVFLFTCI
jgi:hypothetical protein